MSVKDGGREEAEAVLDRVRLAVESGLEPALDDEGGEVEALLVLLHRPTGMMSCSTTNMSQVQSLLVMQAALESQVDNVAEQMATDLLARALRPRRAETPETSQEAS